jgi:hypothetical protein
MPNRKSFDESEKYDHSGHPIAHPLPSDLQPDVKHEADDAGATAAPAEDDRLRGRPGRPPRRAG